MGSVDTVAKTSITAEKAASSRLYVRGIARGSLEIFFPSQRLAIPIFRHPFKTINGMF
jgi:hypothetical protein